MLFQSFRALIIVTISICSTLAFGQDSWTFPDFSATQIMQSRRASMSMKVYLSGSSVRVERSDALSTLYVPAESRVYNLTTYPDHSHQCVVMKSEQAKMLPSPLELLQGHDLKRTPAGTEVIEGHLCHIENVEVTRPDGSRIKSKVWEAEDLQGIPVRIESVIGDITLSAVYHDIQIGTPDQALFSAPAKCTLLEKMGEIAEQKLIR